MFSFADQPERRSTSSVRQLNGPSQLGQRAESADRFSTFEEKIYPVIKSSFNTEHLNFSNQRGSAVRRHPTLQNITTSGDVREDYWEFIKVQAIVIYVQVIHNYNSTFEDANRLVAAPLDGG